jgi:O-antigen ligase
VFRSDALGIAIDNTYYPNNDYLKVLAETGSPGLVLLIAVLALVAWCAVRVTFQARGTAREGADGPGLVSAAAVGAVLIALNMLIGYELLHVFFWINCGAVLGVAAGTGRGRGRRRAALRRIGR